MLAYGRGQYKVKSDVVKMAVNDTEDATKSNRAARTLGVLFFLIIVVIVTLFFQ